MPDIIYVPPYLAEVQKDLPDSQWWNEQERETYHHSRIVEALKAENETHKKAYWDLLESWSDLRVKYSIAVDELAELKTKRVQKMTPKTEDIDRAIADFKAWQDSIHWDENSGIPHVYKDSEDVLYTNEKTIAHALHVLKRLMGEPSKGMNNAGAYSQFNENEQADVIFTTMRDQLLREVENE